ncbi:hypothetical protein FHW36_1011185 [Chitinophaga polysaccharea]|uniref:Uncharacterized protein n=1 Tax=Chitinophaga polysaccharea TaxID=1293035 RepID=A0A561Q4J7_9BACT|nr:hypothetical protein [Chitinophaga polysaccharea]TWF45258.1 hypothetical protein FHW36_1011185 [Chitinophaga polysaccharea]
MKTSNQLLLGFMGLLVIGMLFSAIILKAGYNKGITNNPAYDKRQKPDPDYTKASLPPFKALVLTSPAGLTPGNNTPPDVVINAAADYSLESYKNIVSHQSGDTLFIDIRKMHDITVNCPSLNYIHNTSSCNIFMHGLVFNQLDMYGGPHVRSYFNDVTVRRLNYTGDTTNVLEFGEVANLDSVNIIMHKNGSLYLYTSYNYGDIKVDSLANLTIAGKAVNSLKKMN